MTEPVAQRTARPATNTSRAAGALLVLLGGAAFATSSPLARWARPADPLLIAFGRLALAAVLLALLDARGIAREAAALTRRQRLLVAAGGALLGVHFACYQWGLDHTSLPAAASLVSLEPVSVVVVAWAIFGLRPRPVEFVAIGLATCGAVVVGSAAGAGEHRVAGDVGVLLAVALFGLYLAVARGLPKTLLTRAYAALVYGGAALTVGVMLPWSGAADVAPTIGDQLPLRSFIGIAALAIVPTLVGHTAAQAASRKLAPSLVALVSPLETLGSIAIGAALLGEPPTARELVGAALILAATLLALVRSAP